MKITAGNPQSQIKDPFKAEICKPLQWNKYREENAEINRNANTYRPNA